MKHSTTRTMKVCIVGASGKLDAFKRHITVIPGATNDREVIKRAVAGCDGVLTVLVPWGVQQYSTGTAQAVLDHARPEARLVFDQSEFVCLIMLICFATLF